MDRSKKFLFSVITFIILSLIIILCLYSYNNFDKANALNGEYFDNNSVTSVSFPFYAKSTLVNFNSLNMSYSNISTGSGFNRVYSGDYEYWVPGGITGYTFGSISSSSNISVNGIDIPLNYAYATYNIFNAAYCFSSYCMFDLHVNTTYYVNLILNANATSLNSNFNFIRYGYNQMNIELDFTFNSIKNDPNYKTYDGFIFVSFPFVPEIESNEIGFYNNFTSLYYYCTITDSPSFNADGYFSYQYTKTYDGTTYLDNYIALNSVFSNDKTQAFYMDLFNGIENKNVSLYLQSKTNVFSSVKYFNVYGFTLSTDSLGDSVYTSAKCYDWNNQYYVIVKLYKYSSQYGNNVLVYNFYSSNNTSLSLTYINVKFTFSNSSFDNYNIGFLNGLGEGYENGYTLGYNFGYTTGYNNGLSVASNGSFLGLLSASIESPLNAVLNMFDFELLGYNMKTFYLGLFTVAMILFIIKLFLGNVGGKKGD